MFGGQVNPDPNFCRGLIPMVHLLMVLTSGCRLAIPSEMYLVPGLRYPGFSLLVTQSDQGTGSEQDLRMRFGFSQRFHRDDAAKDFDSIVLTDVVFFSYREDPVQPITDPAGRQRESIHLSKGDRKVSQEAEEPLQISLRNRLQNGPDMSAGWPGIPRCRRSIGAGSSARGQ
jgi:hypothetical protein